MIDERVPAGVRRIWDNDAVRACDHWLAVWKGYKPHLGPEMTRVRDLGALFHRSEYFYNPCQEFENEFGKAGVHDPHSRRACIQYLNELLARLSAEDDRLLLGTARALKRRR